MTAQLGRELPHLDFNDQMFNDWNIHHLHLHDVNRGAGTRETLTSGPTDATTTLGSTTTSSRSSTSTDPR